MDLVQSFSLTDPDVESSPSQVDVSCSLVMSAYGFVRRECLVGRTR